MCPSSSISPNSNSSDQPLTQEPDSAGILDIITTIIKVSLSTANYKEPPIPPPLSIPSAKANKLPYYLTILKTNYDRYPTLAITMKFLSALALLPLALAARTPTSISWDPVYGNGGQSLATVACSDGSNGLLTKGYTTFSSLPQYPNIGGSPTVAGWNSANCGKCYNLYYGSVVVKVRAVDTAPGGWNVNKAVLDKLTGGRAEAVGRVNGEYEVVNC